MKTLACDRIDSKGNLWTLIKQIILYKQYHSIAEAKPTKYNPMYFSLLFNYKTFGAVGQNADAFFGLHDLREITKQTVHESENVTLH